MVNGVDGPTAARDDVRVLERPYLLVSFLPYYEDRDGAVWLEQAWHHDVVEHLAYLKSFTLCAPRLPKRDQPGLVRVDAPPGVRFRVAPLPPQTSAARALRALPRTAAAVWRAVGEAEVVHSSVIGWPFPLGWVANPIAVLRRRRLVVVVESSWRSDAGSWKAKLLDGVSTAMARWSCNHADVVLFTQPAYREALLTRPRGAAYVTPAVWVNEADILETKAAQESWARKLAGPVRLLFAGRLVTAKGIDVLLAALRALDSRGVAATIDVIGGGERREACVAAARELRSVRLELLDPVPYGDPFFQVVQRYHAVLVPSLSDEQPRIVFDASARAVPVIASDTDGLRPHVDAETTGWLVPRGDVYALAQAIERALASAPDLRDLGMAALEANRRFTHRGMHRVRAAILREHLA
jgi:glycosyltransferase involved in cell wall biosynthesis